MIEYLKALSSKDYLYAAVLAFVIMHIITRFRAVGNILVGRDDISMELKSRDMSVIINKCADMFPIDMFYFRGEAYKRGLAVRMVTKQNKIIEGKIIGKNENDVLCIVTNRYVIAHELDKIDELTSLESK